MRVTLLTPTGDRQEAFALCERWMMRQTRQPDEWIVVDDGVTPTECTCGQTIIRRGPPPPNAMPMDLLPANIRAAALGGHIKPGVIVFVEDDDWYNPRHVEMAAQAIEDGYDLAGEVDGVYYHVRAGKWAVPDAKHNAALARTAVNSDWFLSLPKSYFYANCVYMDARMWSEKNFPGRRLLHRPFGERHSVVGMKGMPGRAGLSMGHDPNVAAYRPDPDGSVLRDWVGDDAEVYLRYRKG
jgi:hypothetical protein